MCIQLSVSSMVKSIYTFINYKNFQCGISIFFGFAISKLNRCKPVVIGVGNQANRGKTPFIPSHWQISHMPRSCLVQTLAVLEDVKHCGNTLYHWAIGIPLRIVMYRYLENCVRVGKDVNGGNAPINAHSGQKQPGDFGEIFLAKA